MSFARTITSYSDNHSAKQKAKMVNERRKQALKWLGRNKNQKKPSISVDRSAPCFRQT